MTTKTIRAAFAATLLSVPATLVAQAPSTPPPTSVDTAVDRMMGQHYPLVKRFLLAALDKMPADKMDFRPAPGARTFAETVSHIGIANLASCQRANGEALDSAAVRARGEAATTKAALESLLNDGFAACDKAFADAGDDRMAQNRAITVIHSWEVYGVMTVYLRLNGIVPPSTEEQSRPRDGEAANGAAAQANGAANGAANSAARAAAAPRRNPAIPLYESARKRVTEMAALMPEDGYATRASPDARSFREAIGHMVDTNFGVCAGARNEKSPLAGRKVEFENADKQALTKLLADSYTYCDATFATLAPEAVAGTDVLFQIAHTSEMAGLMGAYLRTRGLAIPNAEADRGR